MWIQSNLQGLSLVDRQCGSSKNSFRVFINHGILWDGKVLYKQKVVCLHFVLKISTLLMGGKMALLAGENFQESFLFFHPHD